MVQNIRNIGGFFSEYYLGQLKESNLKGKLGESTQKQNYTKISKLYEKAELRIDNSTPKHKLITQWIMPLLSLLGFEENKNLLKNFEIKTEKEDLKSDFAFFPKKGAIDFDQIIKDNENPVLLIDIYKWETALGQKLGSGYDNTPLKQMINKLAFANAKWGLIINGPMIWLIKQQQGIEEQSFFEVDLTSIFEESDVSSFEIFWALFRAEMFYPDGENPCLIDVIDKESREQAIKVGEFLKDSVYEAIETFIQGILEEESNELILKSYDLKEIFHQSLLVMYRLLFIFYAESAWLLPINHDLYRNNYSLESIRLFTENPKIKFSENRYTIWESLFALFKMMEYGIDNGDLYITAYNGYLFSNENTPIFNEIKVNDKVLQKVITSLSSTPSQKSRGREPISYHELGVSQLGSIYEDILEYEPKLADKELGILKHKGKLLIKPIESINEKEFKKIIDFIKPGKVYLSLTGGIRKSTGSYYTPEFITEIIIKETLGPLINNKNSEELLKLRILDPAMGSGTFLVSACNYLADIYSQKLVEEDKIKNESLNETNMRNYKRKIIENCIYGVDLNPMAVELAKVSLWLISAIDQKPLNFLDHRLKVGDSLISSRFSLINNLEYNKNLELKKKQNENLSLVRWLNSSFNLKLELKKILGYRGPEFLSRPDDSVDAIKEKYKCLTKLESKNSKMEKIKLIFDLWISQWFIEKKDLLDEKIYENASKAILENTNLNKKLEYLREFVINFQEKNNFFHWELEFPEIFFDELGNYLKNPGFEAILGNPPYLRIQALTENYPEKLNFYKNFYYAAEGRYDIYILFNELCYSLINNEGIVGFIEPNKFFNANYGENIRIFLESKKSIKKIINFRHNQIFKNSTAYTCLLFFGKSKQSNIRYIELNKDLDLNEINLFLKNLSEKDFTIIPYSVLNNRKWSFSTKEKMLLLLKILNDNIPLEALCNINQGIKTGNDDIFVLKLIEQRDKNTSSYWSNILNKEVILENSIMKNVLLGEDIIRYSNPKSDVFVIFPYKLDEKKKTRPLEEDELRNKFPLTYDYLFQFQEILKKLKKKHKTNPRYWYGLHRSRSIQNFNNRKLIMKQISLEPNLIFDDTGKFYKDSIYGISLKKEKPPINIEVLLGILNSKLFWFFMKLTGTFLRGGYIEYMTSYVKNFSISKNINKEFSEELKRKVQKILNTSKNSEVFSKLESEINEIVYKIYNLSKTDVNLLEEIINK